MLINCENRSPHAGLERINLIVGSLFALCALLAEGFSTLSSAGVALGVLYNAINLKLLRFVERAIESGSNTAVIFVTLVKIPILLCLLYALSKTRGSFVVSAVIGLCTLAPAAVIFGLTSRNDEVQPDR